MSDWFDSYMRRLAEVSSAAGTTNTVGASSSTDIAARVFKAGLPAQTNPPTPVAPRRDSFLDSFKGILKMRVGDPALNVIDNISRPLYGVANVFTEAAEQDKATPLDFISRESSPIRGIREQGPYQGRQTVGEAAAAFGRGFSLKDKNTFGDALRESGMDEGWRRAALGFGLDVAADPINLIPMGALAKVAKKAAPSRQIVKGTSETIETLNKAPSSKLPSTVLKVEGGRPLSALPAPTGAPVEGMEAPSRALFEMGSPPAPTSWGSPEEHLNYLLARGNTGPGSRYLNDIADPVDPRVAGKNQPGLFDLKSFQAQAVADTVSRGIARVPAKRQAHPYFKDQQLVGTEDIYDDVVETYEEAVGGVKPTEFLATNLMDRFIREMRPDQATLMYPELPKDFKGVAPKGRTVKSGQKVVLRSELATWVNAGRNAKEKAARKAIMEATISKTASNMAKATNGRFKPGHAISAKNSRGGISHIPFKAVIRDVMDDTFSPRPGVGTGRASYMVPSFGLKAGTPHITYGELVSILKEKTAALPALETAAKTRTVRKKVGERGIFDRARLTDTIEREAWKGNMRIAGFSDSEINALIRQANLGEAKYDALLQKFLNTPFYKSYSLDEFIAGVRAGTIDDTAEDIQRMYRALGIDLSKTKTNKGRISRFEKLVEKHRKILDKNPALGAAAENTRYTEEGQGLLDFLVPGPSKASKASKATSVKGVSDPDSPWMDAVVKAADEPGAAEIIREAAEVHGDEVTEAVLNSPKVELDEAHANIVADAMSFLRDTQFMQQDKWRYVTNKGAQRTDSTPGVGNARWTAVNAMGQYTLEKAVYRRLKDAGLIDFSGSIYDQVMPSLKGAEEVLKANGIHPILGKGKSGIPLTTHDIMEIMGREWADNNYFNVAQGVPHTNIMDAVEMLVDAYGKGVDAQTIWTALRDLAKRPLPGTVKYVDGKPVKGPNGKVLRNPPRPTGFFNTHKKNFNKQADELFVKPLMSHLPEFVKAAENNRAFMGLKTGEAVKELADSVVENFIRASAKGEIADVLRQSSEMRKTINAVTDAHPLGKVEGIARHTQDQVILELGPTGASITSAAKAADAIAAASTRGEIKSVTYQRALDIQKELDSILASANMQRLFNGASDDLPIGPVVLAEREELWDIGQDLYRTIDGHIARLIAPHAGNKHIRPVLIGQRNFAIGNSARFTRAVSELTRKYPTADINSAFTMIQKNTGEIADNAPEVVHEVNRLVKQIFDPKNPRFDAVHRNGMSIHELNRQFDHYGIPKEYRFSNSVDEWTSWDIKDPMDFMTKTHTAMQQVAAYQAVGSSFGMQFGSKVKKPGYVKIINERGKDSILYNFIDSENLYFPREIAQEMTVMDEALAKMTKPVEHGKLAKMVKMYDTVFYAFKAGYTVYRVGHHMRNAVGDLWFNFMDGVDNPKYYKDAFRLLGASRGKYTDLNFLNALQGMGAVDDTGKAVVRRKINGKTVEISPANAFKMMYERGALPDHSVIEDIRFDTLIGGVEGDIASSAGNPALNRLKKPFGGKVRKGAVVVSEVRDHYFRAAHWMHLMENTPLPKGFKGTSDEAMEWLSEHAAQRTRKFHPDGSDLTAFEHDVLRRTFTFYSWARKAIPLVVELMMLKPGRFMALPKGMYEFAQGYGIDLESYGNPFPEDQLFPSFMRDSIQGPVFGEAGAYWGLRTGVPGMDIVDDFLYSPGNLGGTLPQSVTPFARAPMELMFEHKANIGDPIPIMDKSDYIGGQLPNVGYADKVSNKLTGRTVSSGFTDDLYKAKSNEGYEANIGNVGLINWLLGMGLTDMSKPSYIKTAEREIAEGRGR